MLPLLRTVKKSFYEQAIETAKLLKLVSVGFSKVMNCFVFFTLILDYERKIQKAALIFGIDPNVMKNEFAATLRVVFINC